MQISDDTRKQIQDATAKAQLNAGGGAPGAPGDPVAPHQAIKVEQHAKLPDKAKFIGCINGKALYRDGDKGFNFAWDGPEADIYGCHGH